MFLNDTTNNPSSEIPYGYCHCGCGQKTKIANRSSTSIGWVKGTPVKTLLHHRAIQPVIPIEERFWAKVKKTDTCWLWLGAHNPLGYGRIGMKHKSYLTHRLSYELSYGPIPDGLFVCHHCDTPACVKPDHLFLGTHWDNIQDMMHKHRYLTPRRLKGIVKGVKNGAAKLTDSDVLSIRNDFLPRKVTLRNLAIRYNVSIGTISNIVDRRSWKHRGNRCIWCRKFT